MSYNVRIFGHRGTIQLRQVNQQQFTGNIQEALYQPYEWAQLLIVNGATPVATIVIQANMDLATLVFIEVPDGQAVRYEFNPPGRNVAAGNQSPRLSGQNVFPWASLWSISFVDAASFP